MASIDRIYTNPIGRSLCVKEALPSVSPIRYIYKANKNSLYSRRDFINHSSGSQIDIDKIIGLPRRDICTRFPSHDIDRRLYNVINLLIHLFIYISRCAGLKAEKKRPM